MSNMQTLPDSMTINGYLRVGTGKQTSYRCGQFLGWAGCLNVEEHNHATLDGVDHTGKVFVKRVFHSCDKPETVRLAFACSFGKS